MMKPPALVYTVVASLVLGFFVAPKLANADTHRWIVGLATTCADVKDSTDPEEWWHSDESEYDTVALDLALCNHAATQYTSVYYQDYGYTADLQVFFLDHDTSYTNCTGVEAEIYDYVNGWYLGGIHYVHINAGAGVIGDSFVSSNGWNIESIGSVALTQPGCPFTGPHLHQSNRTEVWALHNNDILNDDDTGNDEVDIYPTGSTSSNWLHALEQWW